jgi:hypothetical protein
MDAFYQTFNNFKAVEFVLRNFFANGGNHAWAVSDAGEDFSPVLKQFGNRTTYLYAENNTGMKYWKTVDKPLEWLSRLKWAASQSSSGHMILLEDDVWIRGSLTTIKPTSAIIGVPTGMWWNDMPKGCGDFINEFGKRKGEYKYYGACGGCIFDRKVFLESYTFAVNLLKEHWNKLQHLSVVDNHWAPKIGHADVILTMLFNLSGYEYHGNPEHTECRNHRDWETNGKKIVHDYKAFY